MATMNFRCSDEQKEAIEIKAKKYGFDSVGAYIKFASINANLSVVVATKDVTSKQQTNKIDIEIDKKIKAYKKAYIENYTHYTSETKEELFRAKDRLCEIKPNKKAFDIISKMSHVTGSNKSKKQALKNEEKYIFEIIELFKV
jgi:hypothetical protein